MNATDNANRENICSRVERSATDRNLKRKRVPGVKGPGTHIPTHHSVIVMSRTRIGAMLESANTLDILLYVHDHPMCLRSDIYRNVSRNAHTREKIDMLCDESLLVMEPAGKGNRCVLTLTEKGRRIVRLLLEAEETLRHGVDEDSR